MIAAVTVLTGGAVWFSTGMPSIGAASRITQVRPATAIAKIGRVSFQLPESQFEVIAAADGQQQSMTTTVEVMNNESQRVIFLASRQVIVTDSGGSYPASEAETSLSVGQRRTVPLEFTMPANEAPTAIVFSVGTRKIAVKLVTSPNT